MIAYSEKKLTEKQRRAMITFGPTSHGDGGAWIDREMTKKEKKGKYRQLYPSHQKIAHFSPFFLLLSSSSLFSRTWGNHFSPRALILNLGSDRECRHQSPA